MNITVSVLEMVLPVLVLIGIGALLRTTKLVSADGMSGVKMLVTDVMLPVVLFNALATAHYSVNIIIVFAVIILANAAALSLGFLTSRFMGEQKTFSPFLMACGEVGMLGYALYSLLAGSENLHYLASIDLGNIFFTFTIYLALLMTRSGGKATPKKMLETVLHSKCFIGALLGTIVGATGLGNLFFPTAAGGVFTKVIELITSPTNALILLVVGYDFSPKKEILKPVLKSMAFRFAIMGSMLALSCFALSRLIPFEKNQQIALLLYFFLPAPLFIPIYTKTKEDSTFLSTSLSMYMAVTIAAFIIMAVVFTAGRV
ncbi:MAG: AEC family transporter [Lachnospiraceae bacterium]|nr:AEC family transporter [Lachnospiraceae bacterium]